MPVDKKGKLEKSALISHFDKPGVNNYHLIYCMSEGETMNKKRRRPSMQFKTESFFGVERVKL